MSPDEMGGVPSTMPSNDWWTLGRDLLGGVYDITMAREQRKLLATRRDLVPAQGGPQSSNVRNFPPNQGGDRPQAQSVPGSPLPRFLAGIDPRALLGIAVLLALVLVGMRIARA